MKTVVCPLLSTTVPSGSIVEADLKVLQTIKENEQPYEQSTGRGLELVVTEPSFAVANSLAARRTTDAGQTRSAEEAEVVSDDPALVERAERLRPVGSKVRIMVRDRSGHATPVQVSTGTNGKSE